MTDQAISSMSPQAINEAVARKLGLQPGHCYCKQRPDVVWCCKCKKIRCVPEQETPCAKTDFLPDYCRSIEAAWEIVASLLASGKCVQLNSDGKGVGFWIGSRYRQKHFAEASTAPMAICLAFLKLP